MAHVGNRDDEPEAAAVALAIHGVVEVLGGLAVDRHERQPAQVNPALGILLANFVGKTRCRAPRFGRELERHAVLAQRDLDLHPRIAVVAENLDDTADRRTVLGGLGDELRGHHLPWLRSPVPAGLEQDVRADAAVGGRDEPEAALLVQSTDDAFLRALGDLDDRPLRPAASIDAALPHHHAVAVKHAAHLVRREVEVRAARIRNDEAKPVGMRRDTAGDEIELVRNE